MATLKRRGDTYPPPARARFRPVRKVDPIVARWQRHYAASASFWEMVGPTITAACAHGFDRRSYPTCSSGHWTATTTPPLIDRLAAELADAIERGRDA